MDHFILDGVEMNPEGLHQLNRQVKTQDTSASCQFEVTDEGESGIGMTYQSTAALSCVTAVGSPSPCVPSCSLYQGRGDSRDQVSILYNMCSIMYFHHLYQAACRHYPCMVTLCLTR